MNIRVNIIETLLRIIAWLSKQEWGHESVKVTETHEYTEWQWQLTQNIRNFL